MTENKATVLIVGGAGYIGSHALKELNARGYNTLVLDNLELGHREIVEDILGSRLLEGDINDRPFLDRVFRENKIDAVMHFAAYAFVGESVTNPQKYYRNNVAGTLNLLSAMVDAEVKYMVFSSSCAVYGIPDVIPIPESQIQRPVNPYGMSKFIVERMLADFNAAYGLKSVSFRYFNAAGADPDGLIGEDHDPETHLIPLVLQAALGKRESIHVFGRDYDTPDGTCIRDYIHVSDLAAAHAAGLDYMMGGGETTAFNLGTERGYSVLEVINIAREVTGMKIDTADSDRRPGDPPILVADSKKARNVLYWSPRYPDLRETIAHAWQWHKKRHG